MTGAVYSASTATLTKSPCNWSKLTRVGESPAVRACLIIAGVRATADEGLGSAAAGGAGLINARRVYVYVVALFSFAAALLAAVSLIRELLVQTSYSGRLDVAFQISVLVIATPIYIGHWLWQQRKCADDEEERGMLERRIYLYAVLGGAVALVAANALHLLQWALGVDAADSRVIDISAWRAILFYLIPMAIATGAGLYHAGLLRQDQEAFPDTGVRGSVHRLYLYLFSAAGLTMVFIAMVELIRWLLSFAGETIFLATELGVDVVAAIPVAVVGLALWLTYWTSAQHLFRTGRIEETNSILRKFYLYVAIFIGVGGAVSAAALILAGILRAWLGLDPSGDIREPSALVLAFVLLWFYHSQVLNDDARAAVNTAQQDEIRRIYLYLLSAVGLVALIVGVIGDISTLLFIVDEGISDAHREALSYFTAALIAGAPVWLLTWRKAQQEALREDQNGRSARASLVRKIYLYSVLFVSIMSVLGSAVYVLYRVLQWILTGSSLTLVDVAVPLTIAIVQLLNWGYHLSTLRSDRRLSSLDEVRRLSDMRLALVDHGGSEALLAFVDRLQRAAPGIAFPVVSSEGAAEGGDIAEEVFARIRQAEAIVVPSSLFVDVDSVGGRDVAAAVAASPAIKLVLPESYPSLFWVGLEAQAPDQTAEETLRLLRIAVAGGEMGSRGRAGCGTIAVTLAGVIVLLLVLARLVGSLIGAF
jgi:hypothetical protein